MRTYIYNFGDYQAYTLMNHHKTHYFLSALKGKGWRKSHGRKTTQNPTVQ